MAAAMPDIVNKTCIELLEGLDAEQDKAGIAAIEAFQRTWGTAWSLFFEIDFMIAQPEAINTQYIFDTDTEPCLLTKNIIPWMKIMTKESFWSRNEAADGEYHIAFYTHLLAAHIVQLLRRVKDLNKISNSALENKHSSNNRDWRFTRHNVSQQTVLGPQKTSANLELIQRQLRILEGNIRWEEKVDFRHSHCRTISTTQELHAMEMAAAATDDDEMQTYLLTIRSKSFAMRERQEALKRSLHADHGITFPEEEVQELLDPVKQFPMTRVHIASPNCSDHDHRHPDRYCTTCTWTRPGEDVCPFCRALEATAWCRAPTPDRFLRRLWCEKCAKKVKRRLEAVADAKEKDLLVLRLPQSLAAASALSSSAVDEIFEQYKDEQVQASVQLQQATSPSTLL
jgi:hypothetical protein